jgi:hypothetical protein
MALERIYKEFLLKVKEQLNSDIPAPIGVNLII